MSRVSKFSNFGLAPPEGKSSCYGQDLTNESKDELFLLSVTENGGRGRLLQEVFGTAEPCLAPLPVHQTVEYISRCLVVCLYARGCFTRRLPPRLRAQNSNILAFSTWGKLRYPIS